MPQLTFVFSLQGEVSSAVCDDSLINDEPYRIPDSALSTTGTHSSCNLLDFRNIGPLQRLAWCTLGKRRTHPTMSMSAQYRSTDKIVISIFTHINTIETALK